MVGVVSVNALRDAYRTVRECVFFFRPSNTVKRIARHMLGPFYLKWYTFLINVIRCSVQIRLSVKVGDYLIWVFLLEKWRQYHIDVKKRWRGSSQDITIGHIWNIKPDNVLWLKNLKCTSVWQPQLPSLTSETIQESNTKNSKI